MEMTELTKIVICDAGPIIHLDELKQLSTLAKAFCLHEGEVSALSFARTKDNVLFLTDDAAARLAAAQMNLQVHGTLGILLRSVRCGFRTVDEIKSCLKSIPYSSTLYIRKELIHRAIQELEKYYN